MTYPKLYPPQIDDDDFERPFYSCSLNNEQEKMNWQCQKFYSKKIPNHEDNQNFIFPKPILLPSIPCVETFYLKWKLLIPVSLSDSVQRKNE